MKVKEIMTDSVVSVTPETSIRQVAELMYHRNVGIIPVIEKEHAVGVITDRDIVIRVLAHHHSPETTQVGEMMTVSLAVCHEDDDIERAVQIMRYRRIRRVLVNDAQNRLVGVVSVDEIAAHHDGQLAGAVVGASKSNELPPFQW